MANIERFSISLDTDRASLIRDLVDQGKYPSITSVFDAAADALLEREAIRQEWWFETTRRCEEAEKHPDRLLDHDAFFREVRKEIQRCKQMMPVE
jgi:Arc/MetJ-type ribon-helix-helix transcriptional regulator